MGQPVLTEAPRSAVSSPAAASSLLAMPYLLVCAAQSLSYANKSMLDPVLPLYLADAGFTPMLIGVTFTVFSLASLLVRPAVGNGIDGWSARGVHVLGALALLIPSALYLLPNMTMLIVMRCLHGIGWAAVNTAGTVMASDEAPPGRRSEAFGYLNMGRNVAKAVMPALGLWLVGVAGFPPVLVVSAIFGGVATVVALALREPSREPLPSTAGGPANSARGTFIERGALLPSLLNATLSSAGPVAAMFVALYARERGIENLSAYFILNGLTAILAQLLSRYADRLGRAPVIAAGFVLVLGGLACMLMADRLLTLAVGGVLFSAGVAMAEPALMALAIERGRDGHRGQAVATYTASFQIGAGMASLLWGVVIQLLGYTAMFFGAMAFVAGGLVILGANWSAARGAPTATPRRLT